jgi:precorrin-3B methylase
MTAEVAVVEIAEAVAAETVVARVVEGDNSIFKIADLLFQVCKNNKTIKELEIRL